MIPTKDYEINGLLKVINTRTCQSQRKQNGSAHLGLRFRAYFLIYDIIFLGISRNIMSGGRLCNTVSLNTRKIW